MYRQTRALSLTLVPTLVLLTGLATAQIERQHGAHVHGEARGSLAMDGPDLRIELEIPGVNLIGFEHPPRNDEEKSLLAAALDRLGTGDWLRSDPRAGCDIVTLNAHTHGYAERSKEEEGHGYGGGEHAKHDGKQHGHQHGHDHEHHGHHHHGGKHDEQDRHGQHDEDHHHGGHDHHHDHDHAEFHIVANLECETPERLRWVELELFEEWPGNERMVIDVLTERLATRVRLAPGNASINLDGR